MKLKTKRIREWCPLTRKQAIILGSQTESYKGRYERCPVCNRRLWPKAIYAWPPDVELLYWIIPEHKRWVKKGA